MWGYYGSKSKIINYYPPPKFSSIIEPFAGTAQYALKHWDNNVTLIEKYERITNLWLWLQQCSPQDILSIRRLKFGESTDDFSWDCQEQKDLVGFIIVASPTMPKKKASKWKTVIRPNTQNYKLQYIANSLHKIRHWKIICGDYREAINAESTWFIDPPYEKMGVYYKYGSSRIDYQCLSLWCKSRVGQVIVCESSKAKWLPFVPLIESRGSKRKTLECVWIK